MLDNAFWFRQMTVVFSFLALIYALVKSVHDFSCALYRIRLPVISISVSLVESCLHCQPMETHRIQEATLMTADNNSF